MGEKYYYVPLWHHELHFTHDGKNLIVKCEPELDENMWIDNNNNLYVKIEILVSDLLKNEVYELKCGEKIYEINSKELKVTKEKQVIIFFNEGILSINEDNIFKVDSRSDIYFEIYLK